MANYDSILILDFGSQYTQLIARRIREQNVFCEILPCNASPDQFKDRKIQGIVFSGGPSSVYDEDAPTVDPEIFNLGVPILGICYGMQYLAKHFGAQVDAGDSREYGHAQIQINITNPIVDNLEHNLDVWMSHGDHVKTENSPFIVIASTAQYPAIMVHHQDPIWGLQFHPEVVHTPKGSEIIKNFLFNICECKPNWNMGSYLQESIEYYKEHLKGQKVVMGVSGGVDSTVTAALLNKAIGSDLHCIFINNGLLRKDEAEQVIKSFEENFDFKLIYLDESKTFLEGLKGVSDPEQKRKIIGRLFIEAFDREAQKIEGVKYLAQGTLYPDVIESVSFKGPSVTIKSHHNVGGLPEKMNLKLVEPMRELFKDEVRLLGEELKIPATMLYRHPFPGPGLAVLILGILNETSVDILQQADAIYIEELHKNDLYQNIWQALAVLLPIRSVGVMGDKRTYENVLALRAVDSLDGMTASCHPIPHEVLAKISTRIINEVVGVNRVVYDISSKPPSTIEWE